jgi:DNA-binding transcriptional ArsR family regulator
MSKQTLPVIQLFDSKSSRQLLRFAINHIDDDERYRTGEIAESAGVSRESVRTHMDRLIAFGVFETENPDANIPYHTVADSAVMDLIGSWDGYPLLDLFEYSGSLSIVEFFLTRADPEESYSKWSLYSKHDVAKDQTLSKHLPTVVESGLIETVEGERGKKYTLDEDSEMYTLLYELNEALYETYHEQSAQ